MGFVFHGFKMKNSHKDVVHIIGFILGAGVEGRSPLKLNGPFGSLSLIFRHILSFYPINQSLFLVTEFGVPKIFLQVWWFGCLLLNDTHGGDCNGHEQNIEAFLATKTPLLKTTGPQNYQNTITSKQVQ